MLFVCASLFSLGLILLAVRLFVPVSAQRQSQRRLVAHAGTLSGLLVVASCIAVGYTFLFSGSVKPEPALVGNFGLPTPSPGIAAESAAPRDTLNPADFNQAPGARTPAGAIAANSQSAQLNGVASVFSLAQSSQICEGFADVAMAALLAGSRGETFATYEQKSRQLADRALRLPFVREAGAKPMQHINSMFATLIEEQYYISPKNRAIQLGMIAKVERSMALDAMTQICEMKILEIREK